VHFQKDRPEIWWKQKKRKSGKGIFKNERRLLAFIKSSRNKKNDRKGREILLIKSREKGREKIEACKNDPNGETVRRGRKTNFKRGFVYPTSFGSGNQHRVGGVA